MTLNWRVMAIATVAVAFIIWMAAMAIHSAHAQEEQQQRMPPRADQLKVEWVIFAFVSKDHHPVSPSEYQLEKFPTAVACLARLAKPDAKLVTTRKEFDAAVQAKIPGAISEWSCGAQMAPIVGQAV